MSIIYILSERNLKEMVLTPSGINRLTTDELKSLAIVNKIALNQFEMNKMLMER